MAFIPTNAAQVQQFAGALYGLTAGSQTMNYVLGEIGRTSLDQVLNTYYAASFGKETTLAMSQRIVANLGISGDPATAATTFVNGLLNAAPAASRGAAVKDILATFAGLTADATYGAAARAWVAKVDAALAYSGVVDIPFSPGTNPALPALTVTQDIISGSAGNDVFVARVVQNSLGDQTNTLGTGDVLNGGAGADALLADVVMAATRDSSPMSPIRPETRGIEFAHFTALESNLAQNNEAVLINAAKMNGLSRVGSVGSDASLTIFNLTTLTDSGVYADRRNTSSMTVRMDHSGNDSAFSADVESDMTVLFDQNYLLAGRSNLAQLEVRAVNNVALRSGGNPLQGILDLSFKVDGQDVKVVLATPPASYGALRDAIAAQLTAQGISGVTVSVSPLRESLFSDDVRIDATTTYLKSSRAGDYNPILISSTSQALLPGIIKVDSAAQNANFLNTYVPVNTASDDPVTVQVELYKVGRGGDGGDLTIGGMSTDYNLLNAPDTNKWNAGTGAPGTFASSAKQGVAQFNITVEGDATQPSDLASLKSTNNALRTVNVVAASGSAAGLIIGNRETDARGASINGAAEAMPRDLTTFRNAGLKDVKDFNAATFNNGVELHSWVSNESVPKYMNRTDRAPDQPATDNANFVYQFGSGNDTLNVNISKENLAASGTTNREDFSFIARTGAGNDTVLAQIGDGQGLPTDIWYINHAGQRNISIDGGAGDDTIRTYGSSIWSIVAGEGNDTVYTDNSGAQLPTNAPANASENTSVFNSGRATWVIAKNLNIDNLERTDSIVLANQFLYGARVRVVLSDAQSVDAANLVNGFESTVAVSATTAGIVGVGNQLHINQAIKLAINSDAVLNKLLIAEDGPSNTLVIRSLIDGTFRSEDLNITVLPITADTYATYGASQLADVLAAYRYVQNDLSALAGTAGANIVDAASRSAVFINTSILDASTPLLAQQSFAGGTINITGADSIAENQNSINPGPGNDVIVLSTDVTSVETIVYTGSDIGNDVIVNFFNDVLSFASYLTNVNATTGATISRVWLDQSAAAGVFSANNVVVTSFNTLNAANATTALTYAGLTSDQVLAELNTAGGFTTAGIDASVGAGVSRKSVLMVENSSNAGQYQVFDVTFANAAAGGAEQFTSVVRLGQIDFGSSLVVASSGVSRPVDGAVVAPPAGAGAGAGGGGAVVVPPPAGVTATQAIGAAGTFSGATGNVQFNIALGNYSATITGFGAGDVLRGPTGVAASVTNNSFTDGEVQLSWSSAGQTVTITLTGITPGQDGGIFSTTSFNTVFGPGSI